jgi:hypothetical protein
MTDPKKLSEAEVKRVLSIAMAQPKKDTGSLSLDDLKAGASEVGVPPEKLDDAYRKLRAEQAARKASRKRAAAIAIPLVLVGGLVATCATGVLWAVTAKEPPPPPAAAPPAFTGTAHVTVTTRVENDRPVDALPRVRVSSHRGFEVFVSLSGLQHLHRMRCDFVDESGAVLETDSVTLKALGEPYYVWFKLAVPFNRKPGAYKARVYADDKLVAEAPVEVVVGNTSLTVAPDVKDGETVGARSILSRKKDKQIYAYFHLDDAQGTGANVEFEWLGPDGASRRKNTIAIAGANGAWALWDVLGALPEQPAGAWKVTAKFEGTPAGEATFELR